MSKLEQLMKQQQELEAAIEAERAKSREDAVANVRALIKTYGITLSEVKSVLTMRKKRTAKSPSAKRAPVKRKVAK